MRIDIFTIFPEAVDSFASTAIVGRARTEGQLDLRLRDVRVGSTDVHRHVDDAPYGGGAGMVMMVEPIFNVIEKVEAEEGLPRPLLLLDPGGSRFDQSMAMEMAGWENGFSLLCGRYEGVDQRVTDHIVDGALSVGDVVLAGGEVAALLVLEAVARLVPGVLGNNASTVEESFVDGLLEYPQYTRPADFRTWSVPEVLRSGDHDRIHRWRRAEAIWKTLQRRPDLLQARGGLRRDEMALLADHGYDVGSGQSLPDSKDAPHAPH